MVSPDTVKNHDVSGILTSQDVTKGTAPETTTSSVGRVLISDGREAPYPQIEHDYRDALKALDDMIERDQWCESLFNFRARLECWEADITYYTQSIVNLSPHDAQTVLIALDDIKFYLDQLATRPEDEQLLNNTLAPLKQVVNNLAVTSAYHDITPPNPTKEILDHSLVESSSRTKPYVSDKQLRPWPPATSQKKQAVTGALSPVDLATKPVQYSARELASISGAGVNPYTVIVGQEFAQLFHLGLLGRINTEEAISSFLRRSRLSVDNREFTSTLANTTEGLTLIAISAALSECYSDEFAAQVLCAATASLLPPDVSKPTIREWVEVTKACQGALAISGFSISAVALMSIRKSAFRVHATPPDMAAALFAIGRVSRDDAASIRITGGADAGFLAAMADWLFDLTTAIVDDSHEILFSNCTTPTPQVFVVMADPSDRLEASHRLSVSLTM